MIMKNITLLLVLLFVSTASHANAYLWAWEHYPTYKVLVKITLPTMEECNLWADLINQTYPEADARCYRREEA